MSVQWYAALVILVGFALWVRSSVLGSVVALLSFSLFGGGAAFIVGGSSIQPDYFFLIFLLAHVLLTMFSRTGNVLVGFKVNGYLAFYCVYAAVTALILPKIFARSMLLPPMQAQKGDIYEAVELSYSKENIISGIYLIGTLIVSICAAAAAQDPKSRRTIVNWAIAISLIHVFFGLAGLVLQAHGGARIISFFRNARYAQLDEDTFGFVRVNGIFPEPSAYGGYAFTWFVMMTELWLRHVRPRVTGFAAAALLFMILLCTSTSTYFGVAVYGFLMLFRWVIAPGGLSQRKLIILGMGALAAVTVALAAAAFVPSVADLVARIFSSMTLHKLESRSGSGRGFWAKAGLTAFIKSHGLGVGAGSFRCSSLLLAMLGSTGIIGTTAFLAHIFKIMPPTKASTYALGGPSRDPVGAAAAWTACAGLLPAIVAAPTADPSILFAALGGLALGWRYDLEHSRAQAPAPAAPRARLPMPQAASA